MFELPEAKRVRREDLNASDDGAWSEGDDDGRDAELRARLNAQIARSLGLDSSYAQPRDVAVGLSQSAGDAPSDKSTGVADIADQAQGDDEEDAGNEEFTFRLFSTAQPSQKVVLEEDTEPQGDGGLVAARPLADYLVSNLSTKERREYNFAAMSGDEVLERSKTRYWGLEMPWRVTRITVTRKAKPGELSQQTQEEAARRRRPGKKQRISLRRRAKVKEERAKVEAQKLVEKEEHIKDKKKRMNRLKKLRKRAKNKEMKQTGKAGEGAGDDNSGDESGGSD
ncbi:Fc.00g052340.m01.CDS01 [Cosmosporella sp. VM-42]